MIANVPVAGSRLGDMLSTFIAVPSVTVSLAVLLAGRIGSMARRAGESMRYRPCRFPARGLRIGPARFGDLLMGQAGGILLPPPDVGFPQPAYLPPQSHLNVPAGPLPTQRFDSRTESQARVAVCRWGGLLETGTTTSRHQFGASHLRKRPNQILVYLLHCRNTSFEKRGNCAHFKPAFLNCRTKLFKENMAKEGSTLEIPGIVKELLRTRRSGSSLKTPLKIIAHYGKQDA